mmetsp:Transcript_36643/g.105363  ORF Transcript_36643/g.105363 Transcript_36643/m.105363 type:complete len:218 (+) Transcript_36643:191-844(+)
MALLMAATSSVRICLRSFHSPVLVARAASASPMYFVSASICLPRASISAVASLFDSPRAAPSTSMEMRASWALVFCSFLAVISTPCTSTAFVSLAVASLRLVSNWASKLDKVFWMSPERAPYFSLNVALRLSFFQSFTGTSPVRTRCRKMTSALERLSRAISRTKLTAWASASRAWMVSPLLALNRSKLAGFVPVSMTSMAFVRAAIAWSISVFAAS